MLALSKKFTQIRPQYLSREPKNKLLSWPKTSPFNSRFTCFKRSFMTSHTTKSSPSISTTDIPLRSLPSHSIEMPPRDLSERASFDVHPDTIQAIAFVDSLKNVSTEEKKLLSTWVEDNSITIPQLAQTQDIFHLAEVLPLAALTQLINDASMYFLGCTLTSPNFAVFNALLVHFLQQTPSGARDIREILRQLLASQTELTSIFCPFTNNLFPDPASAFFDYVEEKKRQKMPLDAHPFVSHPDHVLPFVEAFLDVLRISPDLPSSELGAHQCWLVSGGRGIGKTRFCSELGKTLLSVPAIRELGVPIVTATCSALCLPPEEAWTGWREEHADTLEFHCLAHLCYQMISNSASVSETDLSVFKEQLGDFKAFARAIRALNKVMSPKWVLLLHIDDFDERPMASIHALRALFKALGSDEFKQENCIIIPVLSGISSEPLHALIPKNIVSENRSIPTTRQFWVKPLDLNSSATFLFNIYFSELSQKFTPKNSSKKALQESRKELNRLLNKKDQIEANIREIPQFWNLLHLIGGVPSMLFEYAKILADINTDDINASFFRNIVALRLKDRISECFPEPPRESLNRIIYQSFFSEPISKDINDVNATEYDHLERIGLMYRYQKTPSSSDVYSWVPPIFYFLWRPNWFPRTLFMLLVDFRYKEIELCAPFFHRASFLVASSLGKNSVSLAQMYGKSCQFSPSTLSDVEIQIPKKLRYAFLKAPSGAVSDESVTPMINNPSLHITTHESYGGSVETRSEIMDLEELRARNYFVSQSSVTPHHEHWLTPFSGEWYHSLGTSYSRRALRKLTPVHIKSLRDGRHTSPSKVFVIVSPKDVDPEFKENLPEGTVVVCGPEAVASFLHGFVSGSAMASVESKRSDSVDKYFPTRQTHWRSSILDNLAELERIRLFQENLGRRVSHFHCKQL